MAAQLSPPGYVAGTAVFGSGLSLSDQEEQLLNFIADFADRLDKAEDEERRQLVSKRLARLKEDFWSLQQHKLSEPEE